MTTISNDMLNDSAMHPEPPPGRFHNRRSKRPFISAPNPEKWGGLTPRLTVITLACAAALFGSWAPPASAQRWADVDYSALTARNIGPAGMSGRIAAIDALEADPNLIYVGAATGGLWRSVNGGQTWTPVFDDQSVLGIGAVAIFDQNPDIVWVGTGEGNPRNSAGVGAGIYKSVDGGRTWRFLGLKRSERIHRILLHPTDPDVAYVGVMGPAWSDGRKRGVYRTRDGGETWEQVLFVNERTGIGDLVMDPSNPQKLLAGMWEFRRQPWFFRSGGPGSGLFITYDGGDNWTRLTQEDGLPPGELGRIGLAFSRSDPSVAYALVEAAESALLRSEDGGRSWATVNSDPGVASRPFYYADIFVDPENELRLFNLQSQLLVSEDGGETFSQIAEEVHSDNHALWIHPGDAHLMYLGTDGGMYISRDRGRHWRMVDNLPVGQFYHVSVDQDIPFNVYGGMQDNGSWRGPSDLWATGGIRNYHWKEVGFGDGFGTLLDPTDPDLGYAMSQGGGLVRFDLRTGERKDIRPWAPDGVKLRFNWNAAIAADPFRPGMIYYGSQFVHRTTNRGQTWEIISPDLTSNNPEKQRQAESGGLTRDATGAENHTTILTIAPSPVEEELIWVGTDDGRVHLTRSGGGHWEDVGDDIGGVPEDTWIPHIEASRHAPGTAYVVFDDHRRGNWRPYIYRTEDYGDDWDNLVDEDDIPGFVHTIEEDPVTRNLLFAGTEFGLYVSLDRGRNWMLWTHGLPQVPIRSLVVHPRDLDLVIGTHGRSIYILDDIRPLEVLAGNRDLLTEPLLLFDPPPAYLRGTAAADGYHFAGDAMFQGETRSPGALLTYSVGVGAGGGEGDEVDVRIVDDQGQVLRRLTGPGTPGLHRLTWNLRESSPQPPEGAAEGGRFRMPGPEVLPGTYRVELTLGGATAHEDLEVRADPRVEIPMAERIEKRNAVLWAHELVVLTREIQRRLRQLNESVEAVDGEVGRDQDASAEEIRELVSNVRRALEEIETSLGALNRDRRRLYSLGATRDAPTEAERITLARMQEGADETVAALNGLIAGAYEDLRNAATAAGVIGAGEISLIVTRGRQPDP